MLESEDESADNVSNKHWEEERRRNESTNQGRGITRGTGTIPGRKVVGSPRAVATVESMSVCRSPIDGFGRLTFVCLTDWRVVGLVESRVRDT